MEPQSAIHGRTDIREPIKPRTLVPPPLTGHSVRTVVDACRWRFGGQVADRASAILSGETRVESENVTVLAFILGVAVELGEWGLALEIGNRLDRLAN